MDNIVTIFAFSISIPNLFLALPVLIGFTYARFEYRMELLRLGVIRQPIF
jgi:hypothetical protein